MHFVVKVQLPLFSTDEEPEYLVYNEDRSFTASLSLGCDEGLERMMADRQKVYLWAELDDAQETIGLNYGKPCDQAPGW
jgi:hypothetical protein